MNAGLHGRSLRFGSGDRNGASVSTMIRSAGASRAASRTSFAFLYVTTPVKLTHAPASSNFRISPGPPVKQ